MKPAQAGLLLKHVRKLAADADAGRTPDCELLGRFAAERDEAAFTTLVRRHGPMTLRVCRRILHHQHEAEDVCQATFLVLASKAASRNWQASIASWLHRVAYHLAIKANAAAARRWSRERQALHRPAPNPLDTITGRELQAVLDEELGRLPEKFRTPLVLCYLEGATREEAALQLRCPLSTLKSRVERGRELLQIRLAKRGLELASVLSTAVLVEGGVSAALPSLLWERFAQSALAFAGTKTFTTSTASARVLALAETALKSMSLVKLKLAVGILLGITVLVAGATAMVCGAFTLRQSTLASAQLPLPVSQQSQVTKPEIAKRRTDRHGDPLPEGAISRLGTTRLRHGVFVSWLRFTPDGKSLISQGGDGIRIWNPATGEQLRSFPNERGLDQMPYEGTSLSADGKLLAYPGKSGVHICEVTGGRLIRTIETGPVSCVRFSPDGKTLAVQPEISPWPFQLWDIANGRLLSSGAGDKAYFACLAFSPDGKTLITAGSRFQRSPPENDYQIRFWETASGRELRTLHLGPHNPRNIEFSPDGKLLAVVGQGDRGTEDRARIWDLVAGKEIHQLVTKPRRPSKQTAFSSALAFAPDGRTLYTGGIDDELIAWNPVTGEELRRIGTGLLVPTALAVSRDNKTLAVGVAGLTIRLIDLASGKDQIPESGHPLYLLRTVVTADGRTAVTSDPYRVLIWDATTGREVRRIETDRTIITGIRLRSSSPDTWERSWRWVFPPTARHSSPPAVIRQRWSGTWPADEGLEIGRPCRLPSFTPAGPIWPRPMPVAPIGPFASWQAIRLEHFHSWTNACTRLPPCRISTWRA
jgi:RNA polymerase sigma factor (sigma-70 family)